MDSNDDIHDDYRSDDAYADTDANCETMNDDAVDSDSDDHYDSVVNHKLQHSYSIMKESEIRQRMEDDIARVSTVLSVPKVAATILLRSYKWIISNLHDAWFADEDGVRRAIGFFEKAKVQYSFNSNRELTCEICFEVYSHDMMKSATCGHPYCVECWAAYISMSINNDGPGCLSLRCPDPSCGAAVGQDMVDKLTSDEDREKYMRYLVRSYVEDNKKAKWCPSPGCEYAVVDFVPEGFGSSYDINCLCSNGFCYNCTEEAHRPVDCDTVAKWIFKNNAEAENVAWILAYTKPCPQCKKPIEKNDGCMHMTCRPPCNFSFCWLCLGSWSHHGYSPCNSYKRITNDIEENERKRENAKKSIQRYTHYFERWAANDKSRQKALADLKQVQDVQIQKLKKIQGEPEAQLKFVTEAWQQIVECRRVLKWTYAYGYYLLENDNAKRQLFEYYQGQAESALERLHVCAEKGLQQVLNDDDGPSENFNDFRRKLAGLTWVTGNYFENLVKALENGLSDVKSHGAFPTNIEGSLSDVKSHGARPTNIEGGSSSKGNARNDNGYWTCERCTFSNANYRTTCEMCYVVTGYWACELCTYANIRSPTECEMCHQPRRP